MKKAIELMEQARKELEGIQAPGANIITCLVRLKHAIAAAKREALVRKEEKSEEG